MADNAGARNPTSSAAETSVSGLSDDFCNAVRAFATSRDETLKTVYSDAILDLVERVNSGEDIFFPTVIRKEWKSRHIRITAEAKEALINTADRLKIYRSVFFHKAVRDYLSINGIDAPQ